MRTPRCTARACGTPSPPSHKSWPMGEVLRSVPLPFPPLSLFKVYERTEQQTAPATPEDDAQREATGELAARPQRARSQSRKLTAGKRSKVRGPLSFYPDLWFRFLGAKSILQPAAYIGSSRAKPELKADRIGRPQSEIGDDLAARISPRVSPPLPPTTSAAPSVSSLLYPSLSPNRMSPSLHSITCHGRGIMCLLYVSLPSPLDRIAMGNNIAKWPKLQSPLRAQWSFKKCGRSA